MKYQVGVTYTWQGEFSVEAESEEEAKEIVRDETFGDPWTDANGNHTTEINEVYEWDEAAQERNREETRKLLDQIK
jgi:hypothetical protein